MTNEIKVFNNEEFGQVRTVVINNEIWFVGKDIAEILGYSNPNEAVKDHVDEDDKLNSKTLSSFSLNLGQRGGWIINESGLYGLILSSKLPTAKKFKKWVTSEVLPSIRKTGSYSVSQKEDEKAQLLLTVYNGGVEAVVATRELVALETAPLKDKIEEDKPKVDYHDKVLQSKDLMPISVIAKDYGLSAVKLNRILHEEGVQFKQGKTWLLYQDYANQGLTHTKTYTTTTNDGKERTVTHTQWTQKGRHLIHDILKRNGYLSTTEKIALNLLENPIIIKK